LKIFEPFKRVPYLVQHGASNHTIVVRSCTTMVFVTVHRIYLVTIENRYTLMVS
jgi:hypothetical protein